ncbi:hypothetical protein RCIP0075_00019 [Klebsiella phage RCIP0075]
MNDKGIAYAPLGGLGAGAAYLNWVSQYGAVVLTTLGILVAVLTLFNQGRALYLSFRDKRINQKEKDGDVHCNEHGGK